MTNYPAPAGRPPTIAMIAPADLLIDSTYQRSIDASSSRKLIEGIANAWDWRLCVPLIVADRQDGQFVIDGQHRREAALLRGDIAYLLCSVSRYADAAEEARLFVAANRGRRRIGRVDEFRAAVAAGEGVAGAIDALITAAGLSLATADNFGGAGAGQINFTSGLRSAFKRFGSEIVGESLKLLGWAFAGQVLVHGGAMFGALCELLGPGEGGPRNCFRSSSLRPSTRGAMPLA